MKTRIPSAAFWAAGLLAVPPVIFCALGKYWPACWSSVALIVFIAVVVYFTRPFAERQQPGTKTEV